MATIKERGTIAVLGEVQSGTSQSGNPWYRQTIVVNVEGYRGSFRPIAVRASGKVVGDLENAMVGDKVEISYEVTGREYQGRWYNNVDLYKVEFLEPQMQQFVAPAYQQQPMVQTQPAPQMSRAQSAYDVCQNFCRQANCDYNLGTHGEACKMAMMAGQFNPAPAAPAAPALRRGRPAVQSQPQIPANTPMDLQGDDLPPAFFQ